MRIAFVVGTFPTLSETFILSQIVGLLRRGHEVEIYANPSGDTETIVDADVHEYKIIERVCYRKPIRGRRQVLATAISLLWRWGWRNPGRVFDSLNVIRHGSKSLNLFRLLDSFPTECIGSGYDLIHCHYGPNGQRAVAARQGGAFAAPVVTTFHGYDANLLPRTHGPKYYQYLFRHGDLFTVGSEFMRRRIVSLGAPPARIAKLPMGVDTSYFEFRERRYRPERPVTLLTVARLVEVKGIEYTLRGFATALSRIPYLRLFVAGDGPLRGQLQMLANNLGIADKVRFLGAVKREQVPKLHSEADIFILSSIVTELGEEENQPVVLAEAQASGLPVIATAIGGVPESIKDGESGILVPPRDAEAIASAIQRLVENHEAWGQMGKAGRSHIERNYDAEKLHDQLVELYSEVLQRH